MRVKSKKCLQVLPPPGWALLPCLMMTEAISRFVFLHKYKICHYQSVSSTTPSPSPSPYRSPIRSPARSPSPTTSDSHHSLSSHVPSSRHSTVPAIRTPRSKYQVLFVLSLQPSYINLCESLFFYFHSILMLSQNTIKEKRVERDS